MWTKRTIQLDKKFRGPTTKPDNNLFVANLGDVSFEYPDSWIVKPSDRSTCFHDAEPPADECVLEFSIIHLNFRIDWGGLPLARMLCDVLPPGQGPKPEPDKIHQLQRGDLQIAWVETEFIDPVEKRQALTRCALAREADVLPLLTFSFWPEHREKLNLVWEDVLETLRLAGGGRFKSRN